MSRHSEASVESKELCDRLLATLEHIVPELERRPTSSSCGLLRSGWSRFAYTYHSKTKAQVEVWCRGGPDDLAREASKLTIRPHEKCRAAWEEAFPCRFTLADPQHIEEAARLLANVSFRASARR